MTLTGFRVSFVVLLVILAIYGVVTEVIFSAVYWSFIAFLTGAFVLIDMTTAAAFIGVKGAKLQKIKSKSMVTFECSFLLLAICAWAGVHWLDISAPAGEHWSPVFSSALTAISIGIIIKFLDVEWTLMGEDFEKERYGTFSIGFIICLFSAFGIAETSHSEILPMSLAKISFSLGVSVLVALSSRFIDGILERYSQDG